MEFDAKKHFPTKEGFGEVAISVPVMQSDIARLQALLDRREKLLTSCMMQRNELQTEVERLRSDNDIERDSAIAWEKVSYTAWNDAIEAAATEAANWWAYLHDDQDKDGPVANAIRALKRT